MNWKSSSRTEEFSVSEIASSRASTSAGGNPPAFVSRFFRWMKNSTPSEDKNLTSESRAQTMMVN